MPIINRDNFSFGRDFQGSAFLLVFNGAVKYVDYEHGWKALCERVYRDIGADLTHYDDKWDWTGGEINRPYKLEIPNELTIIRINWKLHRKICKGSLS